MGTEQGSAITSQLPTDTQMVLGQGSSADGQQMSEARAYWVSIHANYAKSCRQPQLSSISGYCGCAMTLVLRGLNLKLILKLKFNFKFNLADRGQSNITRCPLELLPSS
eukprot:COSAG01_NODE_20384_length_957_cov_1.009324_1_plen_108_part_10